MKTKIPPKLLADVLQTCLENNVSLYFVDKKYIGTPKNKFAGYFDDKKIVVATKDREWLDVLLHESCHLDQYNEKHPLWSAVNRAITTVDDWISGEEISNSRVRRAIKNIIALEHDCEKRTLKKIDYYNLPIDKKHYIAQANAYLLGYWATYRKRGYCVFPYKKQEVLDKMPKKILPLEFYFRPDKKYISLL